MRNALTDSKTTAVDVLLITGEPGAGKRASCRNCRLCGVPAWHGAFGRSMELKRGVLTDPGSMRSDRFTGSDW
jgi:hypothetical protein